MSPLDPSTGREPVDPGTEPHRRHRARHADAAPDPYPTGPPPERPYGRTNNHPAGWSPEPPFAPPIDPVGDTVSDPAGLLADGGRTGRSRAQRRAGARHSRAGRNLPAAIGVGVALAALVLGSLFLWRPAFLAVIVAAVSVGIWETVRAVRVTGAQPPLLPLLAGGAVMVTAAWWHGPDALSLGLLVTVLATMVWRLADGPAGYQRDVSAATLIAVYVPFLAGFAALLAGSDDGHWRVLITLAVVVLSDTGGYVAGVFFGRRRLAPSISPKKSWEGLAGSLTAAAVGAAVLGELLLGVAWWWGAVFGLVTAAAAVLGDLAESLLKRDVGVKDMSGLLPGHGGLMDRLDSILFAAPTAYLLLGVLAPVS